MVHAEHVDQPSEVNGASRPRRMRRRLAVGAAVLLGVWLAVAYVLAPLVWERLERRHPSWDDNPRLTQTGDGHPGDPLNVALIGGEADIRKIMQDAGWFPAAPLGLRSDLKIAADTVLSRPDDEAPVSSLYLFDRREDLAFEQPVGDNPRQRHHVRFWKTRKTDDNGQPLWIGAASYDERVGLSHTTGQITHHISGDVDAERDHVFANLRATGELADEYVVDGFHKVREGRNGGGDRWWTDGRLLVGVVE